MTYRAVGMTGLGADVPCQWFQPGEVSGKTSPVPCVDPQSLMLIGAAKFGLPPPAGIPAAGWEQYSALVARCRPDRLPACYTFTALMFGPESKGGHMPACLDANAQAFLAYAEAHPGANGPDPALNALVWAAGKAGKYLGQTYAQALAKKPVCGGVPAPPPPGAGPDMTMTAGPDLTAPPTSQKAGMTPMKWGLIGLAAVAAVGVVAIVVRK
jgi:hypothetical protein